MRVKSRLFGLPVSLAVVIIGLFASHLLYAQMDTGTVAGTVRNPSGEGAASATPDCTVLDQLRVSMKTLIDTQSAKWSYMSSKIDAELAK